MSRSVLVASAMVLAGAVAAFATPGAPLNNLAACRLDPQKVALSFSFEGSACVADQPAEVSAADPATLAVTIPLAETAEVCTMQIVPVAVEQTLDAGADVAAVQVAVIDPKGNAIATGETAIGTAGEGCSLAVSNTQ